MKAADFLSHCQGVVRDRGAAYGDTRDNMDDTAKRWSSVIGAPVTPAQVALCMIELKLSRLREGLTPDSLDSITDIAGYAAIIAELITD
jgi:hypothetical protein